MLKLFRFLGSGLSSDQKQELIQLEKKIQYHFKDPCILKTALCHKSFVNECRNEDHEHYERYEFLGDAVLELVISDLMMQKFPDHCEGKLSKLRAALVNEKSLAKLARELNLGDHLFLGKGEENCGGRNKDSLLADTYEAVIGAIYLDGGFDPSYRFIQNEFRDLLHLATSEDIIQDYKTRLQEKTQEYFKSIPKYKLISESGPDHAKTFEIHIMLKKEILGIGIGRSKKQAEQNAAKKAIRFIEEEKNVD